MTKKKLYSFDDHPEHREMLRPWADRWIANAMSTAAMTDDDRAACVEAVNGLYAAAKLPPPKHIVFVPSPFVLRFSGGFAAAIWHMSKTGFRPKDATDSATRSATLSATYSATLSATDSATRSATRSATDSATRSATDYWVFKENPIAVAARLGVGEFGIKCAQSAYNMWHGSNQWSAWDSYLSFFQDVAGLDLPEYENYRHWRTLAERSGPRIMHPDFCMISDRPEILKVDDENRPHSETGPFCRWRDGSAIYAWHGQFVPAAWLEGNPPTAAEALHWPNMDQRTAACEIVGWANILDQLDATVIEDSGHPKWGRLVEVDIPDSGRERFLDAVCGTGRRFALPVPPNTKTVDEAQSVLHGGLPASLLRLAADART